jgi:hypothetical protein
MLSFIFNQCPRSAAAFRRIRLLTLGRNPWSQELNKLAKLVGGWIQKLAGVLNQAITSLVKFIEKNSNICDTQSLPLEHYYLVQQIFTLSFVTLTKLNISLLRTKVVIKYFWDKIKWRYKTQTTNSPLNIKNLFCVVLFSDECLRSKKSFKWVIYGVSNKALQTEVRKPPTQKHPQVVVWFIFSL